MHLPHIPHLHISLPFPSPLLRHPRSLPHPHPHLPQSPPPHALVLAIDALAVHRATRLITEDELTRPLRERIHASHPPASSRVGYVLTCPYCASIYAAFAISLTHIPQIRFLRIFVYSLAIADVTAILADRSQKQTGWS